jgi:Protein of unknown function (DUF4013)
MRSLMLRATKGTLRDQRGIRPTGPTEMDTRGYHEVPGQVKMGAVGAGASFAWPFRGRWPARWLIGVALVVVLPLGFIPLLGYSIACTRAAASGADEPPAWRHYGRLLLDGVTVAAAIGVVAFPFVLVAFPLAALLANPALWRSTGPLLHVEAWAAAILIVALPLGIALLLVMPHATARYAATGKQLDLFDFAASVRGVQSDFAAWNLAVAAIVTAWAVGVACVALLCAGLAPGVFYAILVSAHATASVCPSSSQRRPEGANSSAR